MSGVCTRPQATRASRGAMALTARPRLLSHLRDMLAEKEQDIAALQTRLRTSEALCSGRLERLEASLGAGSNGMSVANGARGHQSPGTQLQSRIEALERAAAKCGLPVSDTASMDRGTRATSSGSGEVLMSLDARVVALERAISSPPIRGGGEANAELVHHFQASQQLVARLTQQLDAARARHVDLENHYTSWRSEAEARRVEVDQLRAQLGAVEAKLAQSSAVEREMEALHAKLGQSVSETSLLRSKLSAKEKEVSQLERRVAELEGWNTGNIGSQHNSPKGLFSGASDCPGSTRSARDDTSSSALDETNPSVLRHLVVPPQQQQLQQPLPLLSLAPRPALHAARTARTSRTPSTSEGGCGSNGGPRPVGISRLPQVSSPLAPSLASRLTGAISARDLHSIRDQSPLPAPRGATGDMSVGLIQRSQSVPVFVHRSSPNMGNGGVPLGRWAAAPMGGSSSSNSGGIGAPISVNTRATGSPAVPPLDSPFRTAQGHPVGLVQIPVEAPGRPTIGPSPVPMYR